MHKKKHESYRLYTLLKEKYSSSCFIAIRDWLLKRITIITNMNSRLCESWCFETIETMKWSYSLVSVSSFSYPWNRYIYQYSTDFPSVPTPFPVACTYPRRIPYVTLKTASFCTFFSFLFLTKYLFSFIFIICWRRHAKVLNKSWNDL